MSHAMRFAISLPRDTARQVERLRKETGESRSAFIRKAIERVFEERRHAKDIQDYIEGYRKHPDTAEEIEAAETSAAALFAAEPWE